MQRRFARLDQRHASFAAGDQECGEIQLGAQRFRLGDEISITRAGADDGLELGEIRREQCGPRIRRPVTTLGVDQHRLAGAARGGDECGHIGQRALAVVAQNHRVALLQRRSEAGDEGGAVEGAFGIQPLFEVHAQQLLVARHHAQLGDSGGRTLQQLRRDAGRVQGFGEQRAIGIVAHHAERGGLCAECG